VGFSSPRRDRLYVTSALALVVPQKAAGLELFLERANLIPQTAPDEFRTFHRSSSPEASRYFPCVIRRIFPSLFDISTKATPPRLY